MKAQCVASAIPIDGNYTVTPVSDDSKPDKNAIGVSGTITLPEGERQRATEALTVQ